MVSFLHSIAEAYCETGVNFENTLFLFPNKRSGTFFLRDIRKILSEKGVDLSIMPAVTTISDFVEETSGLVVANRIVLLFRLYLCYLELVDKGLSLDNINGDENLSFEAFRNWGETVLSDFNTVDQYLGDPEEIFENVKNFRSIASQYLTEEQIEVMKDYFGHDYFEANDEFWRDFDLEEEESSELKKKFILLWRIMYPLYEKFIKNLTNDGLTSPGYAYRKAYEVISEKGIEAVPYNKIVVIGFNALNLAEYSIFRELADLKNPETGENFADFFWDATGPVFKGNKNSASRFVRENIKKFPCPDWALPYLKESDKNEMPEIKIIASPSDSAQTKITGELLLELKKNLKTEDEFKKANVAVVLPDERLLIPMLYSVPNEIGNINLTTGYSFRLSSVYSFLQIIRRAAANISESKKTGERHFFNKDLRLLFSHPLSRLVFGSKEIDDFRSWMDNSHIVRPKFSDIIRYIPEAEAFLNFPISEGPIENIINYYENIINTLRKKIEDLKGKKERSRLVVSDLNKASDVLAVLKDIVSSYDVKLMPLTFARLYERDLANETIKFEGEPLKGLQVMGTLETRALDFDYLYILSMNEGVMPAKSRTKSFIPDTLRRGYGLPPSNYAEEIFAYYFYRMISRAKSVTLIYDARTGGSSKSAGVSRYIQQLRHVFAKGKIKEISKRFQFADKESKNADIAKTPEIKAMLEEFLKPDGKYLSATYLSTYRECQVRFFLQRVLKLDTDPEPGETISDITLGNILHEIMMELYLKPDEQQKLLERPKLIEKIDLEKILKNEEALSEKIKQKINHHHFKKINLDEPLEGSSLMISEEILNMVKKMVEHDLKLAPFEIYGAEIRDTKRITLPSGKQVNFNFAIDRLDVIDYKGTKRLRIVDYKTGSRKRNADNLEELFDGDYKSEQLFQLFVYAWLLQQTDIEGVENIMTEIYYVPDMENNAPGFPKINNKLVEGFGEYNKEFSEKIEKMLDSIFEDEYFKESSRETECEKCAFKLMCGK